MNKPKETNMTDAAHDIVKHPQMGHGIAHADKLHPLVAAVLETKSVDDVEKLLEMQERWEAREAKKAFTSAMQDLKRDLPRILHRNKLVKAETRSGEMRYTHTSLDAAVEAVVPHLLNHGFTHGWKTDVGGSLVSVTCELTHSEGHTEGCTLSSAPDNKGSKSPPQAVASAVTMLQRYTLLALLGIATADMQDPEPAVDPAEAVDAKKNLRAAGWLRKNKGISIEYAAEHLGKPIEEWTGADLAELKRWATEEPSNGEAPANEEPGD